MLPLENRIIDLFLTALRKRAAKPVAPERQTLLNSGPSSEKPVTQREARLSDFEAIAALKQRLGLAPDSHENWQRLWRNNPALGGGHPAPCMGWLLEVGEKIVGYLGSIPLLYHYGERALFAAVASGFAVEPAYRAFCLGLVASFFNQKNIDLFLNTTAIEAVGKITRAFKADPLPQKDYDNVLFWVLDSHNFSRAIFRRLNMNPVIGKMASTLSFLALRGDGAIRKRWPRGAANGLRVNELNVNEFDDEFQGLWLNKLKERPRLLADRTPAMLRWHFEIPGSRRTTKAFRCDSDKGLVGYAAMISEEDDDIHLRRSTIADMLVLEDDPQVVELLLVEAYEHANAAGSHVLEVLGFPRNVRQICLKWKPYSRKYPACPFFYRASDELLHAQLGDEDAWYACPFDGDTTLTR